MDDPADAKNAIIAMIPKSPVYTTAATTQGLEIRFRSTVRGALNRYKQGGSALVSPKVRKLVTALRLTPKVLQLNQDIENWKHTYHLIDILTNL